MLSNEDYKRLFGDSHLTDKEISEFRESLQIYISKFLDNYFIDDLQGEDLL